MDRVDCLMPEGLPVADLLRHLGLDPEPIFARVFIDGQPVPKAQWEWAVPSAGQVVTIRVIPTGGEGGGKDILRAVAMIGIVIASIFAPYLWGLVGSGYGAALTATLAIGGSLAVNALIPPARPKLQDLSSTNLSPTLSLTGSANRLAPYAPIPRVYGTHRVFPPLAAQQVTDVVGSDQYLRLLFCVGYGPLALSDFKIGQTPIEQFQNVEMEIRYGFPADAPLTIFPDDVFEDALSIKLTNAGGYQQRTSQANAKELSVDVVFPNGLILFNQTGPPSAQTVLVTVEYRLVGTVPWTTANSQPAVAATVTTSFTGANNDLVITARTGGAFANAYSLVFLAGSSLSVTKPIVTIRGQSHPEIPTFIFQVILVSGSTTSAAVRTALEAHAEFNALFTVAHAPGNDGTGAITIPTQLIAPRGVSDLVPITYQLSGGKDGTHSLVVTATSPTLVRANLRWIVDVGQYEVRLKRLTPDTSSSSIRDEVFWTMLRTIQNAVPVNKTGLCLVAMRIKATDQLNGTVDQFNCLAQSLLLDWTGTSWVLQATNNPASVYRDILQGSANARPLPDARLDLATLQAFHARCAAKNLAFNAVIDFRTTVFELARDVLAAGRASFGLRDGKYSVVEDLAQTTPVQHFTPRNSWGFRGTKTFADLPHALKTRFVNPEKDWQQDERLVYADGYSAVNATKFETFDLIGVTDYDQAWKLGRYHLAVAQLRPETYELTTDVENLVCTRGDLVRVVHDVPLFGAGYGRIKSLTLDGSNNATAFTLDDVLTMSAGVSYAVRFRKSDGSSLMQQLVTVAGEQSTFAFTAAIPSAMKPAVGDLALLGVLNAESVELIVKEIQPAADLTAKLTLVDAAPAVLTADSGSIPPFDSQITLPASVQPPKPVVIQVQSDESVLLRDVDGSYQSRILITLHFLSGTYLVATHIEAQYQVSGSQTAWSQIFSPVSGTAVEVTIAPVEDAQQYDIRLRAVNRDRGQTSDWIYITRHTVVGKTTRPPDVSELGFNATGIGWAYPTPPIDFDGFLVRSRPGTSPVWDDAFQLNDVPITNLTYPIIADGSTRVLMVKAVDVAGLESANPAWILQDASALVLRNLAETIDLKTQGFPGTLTNCTVVGGNLTADSQTLFWSNDTAQFWSADGATFWNGTYQDMSYVFTVTPPDDWLTGIMRLQLGITAQGWTLEYRTSLPALFWTSDSATFWTSDSALFWSAGSASFVTWPGAIEFPKRQDYDFRLSAGGGQIQGIVTLLNILFDMPDLRERFDTVLVQNGGTRLPLTKTFHAIKAVTATLIGTTDPASKVKVLDNQLSPGPLVECFDDANADALGHVYAVVDGY